MAFYRRRKAKTLLNFSTDKIEYYCLQVPVPVTSWVRLKFSLGEGSAHGRIYCIGVQLDSKFRVCVQAVTIEINFNFLDFFDF